jgi:hypothetical protein
VNPPAPPRAEPKLTPWDRRQLARDLAEDVVSRRKLATRYGVSHQYLTKFARQHATEIDAMRDRIGDEFAGQWIADKQARIAAYQADYEAALDHPHFDHHEWLKARTQILHAVAEELGALPPRAAVMIVPVTHIVQGVDLDALT